MQLLFFFVDLGSLQKVLVVWLAVAVRCHVQGLLAAAVVRKERGRGLARIAALPLWRVLCAHLFGEVCEFGERLVLALAVVGRFLAAGMVGGFHSEGFLVEHRCERGRVEVADQVDIVLLLLDPIQLSLVEAFIGERLRVLQNRLRLFRGARVSPGSTAIAAGIRVRDQAVLFLEALGSLNRLGSAIQDLLLPLEQGRLISHLVSEIIA